MGRAGSSGGRDSVPLIGTASPKPMVANSDKDDQAATLGRWTLLISAMVSEYRKVRQSFLKAGTMDADQEKTTGLESFGPIEYNVENSAEDFHMYGEAKELKDLLRIFKRQTTPGKRWRM